MSLSRRNKVGICLVLCKQIYGNPMEISIVVSSCSVTQQQPKVLHMEYFDCIKASWVWDIWANKQPLAGYNLICMTTNGVTKIANGVSMGTARWALDTATVVVENGELVGQV